MPGGKDGLNCEGEGEGAERGGEVRCGGKSIFFHFASGDTNKMGANSPPGDASTAARRCLLRLPPCRQRRCCHHPSLSRPAFPPPRPQPAPSFLLSPSPNRAPALALCPLNPKRPPLFTASKPTILLLPSFSLLFGSLSMCVLWSVVCRPAHRDNTPPQSQVVSYQTKPPSDLVGEDVA